MLINVIDKYDITLTLIVGTLIVFVAVIFSLLLFTRFKKREAEHAMETQRLHFQFNEALLTTQLEIQEQTLNNVSQEIHDNIGQVLTLAKLTVNTIASDDNSFESKKLNAIQLLGKAIQDLRHLSKGLNSDYVSQLGLVKAIEYEMEFLRRTGTFNTSLSVNGNQFQLNQQQDLIMFRIFQEVLNNIIKHSKASDINVDMQFYSDFLAMEIRDNGLGFELNILERTHEGVGIGLNNMRNRAKLINAELSIDSNISSGTKVKIQMPKVFLLH